MKKSVAEGSEDLPPQLNNYGFPFKKVCFLRHYHKNGQLDREVTLSFMQQNNMLPTSTIDSFICKYFLELNAISHSLKGSSIEVIYNTDLFPIISSFLNFNDVDLMGAANQSITESIDVIHVPE